MLPILEDNSQTVKIKVANPPSQPTSKKVQAVKKPTLASPTSVEDAETASSGRPLQRLIPANSASVEALPRPTMSPHRKAYKAFWSLQLGGQFIRDSLANQKTQSALGLNLGLDYDFTEIFWLSINPRVSFRNGHVQAATSTNGRENSLELINAAAVVSDRNHFLVSIGALDMTAVHSSLLVSSTFPAIRAQVSTGEVNPVAVTLIGMSAVPSSATLTNNSRDYDKTPSFNSASVRVAYRSSMFEGIVQLGGYEYKDIPLNVSTDSTFLGNTPIGPDNSQQVEFRYQYKGLEARLGGAFALSRSVRLSVQAGAVRNSEAPASMNQGYLIGNQLEVIANSDWTLIPSFTYFRVEPDATVANYNDALTSTNRIGYSVGLNTEYRKLFKVGAYGGEREVVFRKTSQARERFMNVTLETFDVFF